MLPALGGRQIASVTSSDIQHLTNDLAARLAPRTVHRALGVVHAMFAYALAHDLLGRSPFRSINKPREERTRRRLPSGEQLTRLVEAIPTQYQPMLYCAVVLGVRFSEIAGLRVGAIDTEHGMLTGLTEMRGTRGPQK